MQWRVWKKQHSLEQIVAADQFKTYDQLEGSSSEVGAWTESLLLLMMKVMRMRMILVDHSNQISTKNLLKVLQIRVQSSPKTLMKMML